LVAYRPKGVNADDARFRPADKDVRAGARKSGKFPADL
jgi:hypothetical protein